MVQFTCPKCGNTIYYIDDFESNNQEKYKAIVCADCRNIVSIFSDITPISKKLQNDIDDLESRITDLEG